MAPPSPTTRQALAPMAEKSLNIPEFKQRLSDMKSPKSAAVKSTVQHESSSPIGAALVAIKLQRAAQALKAQQTAPSSTTKTSLIGAKLDELRFQHPDPAATAVPLGLQDKRNALSTAPVCSVGPSSEFRDAVNKSRAERLDIASMKTRDGDNEDMQAQLQFAGAFIDNIIGSVAYDLYGQNGAATTAPASPVMDAPRADAKIRPWNSSALNAPRMPGKRSTYNRWIWSPSMGISQEDKWRLCGLSATECGSLQSVIAANDEQQVRVHLQAAVCARGINLMPTVSACLLHKLCILMHACPPAPQGDEALQFTRSRPRACGSACGYAAGIGARKILGI